MDPICDKIFALSLFSLLMAMGACPPWFLGLLVSTGLFQSLGLILIKLSKPAKNISFGSIRLGKWNTALQFIWIVLLVVDTFVLHRGEEPALAVLIARNIGYILLSGLQLSVFLRYFFAFSARDWLPISEPWSQCINPRSNSDSPLHVIARTEGPKQSSSVIDCFGPSVLATTIGFSANFRGHGASNKCRHR